MDTDLEALPVDDGGASLIVLLLADPHLLESGQGGQDGAADPDGVFSLRGSDDLQGGEGRKRSRLIQKQFLQRSQLGHVLSRAGLTLIFIVLGARAVISFCIRSAIPGYMVVPPDSTLLAYRSLRISMSHFMMLLYAVSWIPADSIPGQVTGQR